MDIFYLILIFQFGVSWCENALKYQVNEEKDVGFVLGNINNYVMSNLNGYQSYEVSAIHEYFNILPSKNLVIKKKIDLETLCSDSNLCCSNGPCLITFAVFVNSVNQQRNRFDIEVEVLDINDNKPTFKSASQTLVFPENSNINYGVLMETCNDNDFSIINQIQTYTFLESSGTFALDSSEMNSLTMRLKKPIDYERQSVYHGKLSACDSATRCVDQPIIINVQDVNDNFPTFEKPKYEIEILESFEIGKVVIAARAIDLDGEQFNKTKYEFHDNPGGLVTSKFRVNQSTGDIILKSKLTVLQRQIYNFKISAVDSQRKESGKKDIAEIVIHVVDINDNKPNIEVFHSPRITDSQETFEMKIFENERAQKLMEVKVSDADLGQNSQVMCELKDHSLSLELKQDGTVYEIHSVRSFDYEQEKQIRATFECRDGGSPPLRSYKSIRINIEDVNEYSPVFEPSEFHGSVSENKEPGEVVLTVRAFDKDGAAILTYSLDDAVSQYFAINPRTGVIKTASVPFDREQISMKSFRVSVTDAVINARSAEATVRISILDENDNDPVFVASSLNFFISENEPIKTKLRGQLHAIDLDKDHSNKFVMFKLLDTYNSNLQNCTRPFFNIRVNGEIESLAMLDRETNNNFTLTIEAHDKGNPPRFTRANATVIVYDVNDNSPQWIYPRQSDFRRNSVKSLPTINISESSDRFHVIMQVKAHDPDEMEAGRVSYLLINNHQSLFTLNDTSGELLTDKSPLPYGQYQLQLRATDHGTPSRNTDSWIVINVIDNGKLNRINLTIIIGMVAITALISVFLIVAIICVRRRPRYQQSYLAPSNDISKDHQCTQYFPSHNQWLYQTTEDGGVMQPPPLSDNDSCIYMASNFYEQQDPLILHSLAGSRPASRLDYSLVLPSSHQGNNSEHKFGSLSSQNGERTTGTLRSNQGQYYGLDAPPSGITINGQELDGDSADSGKGASEVDLRLQYHLNNVTRNYPTMPFPHHSTTTSSMFGYPTNMSSDVQYYSNGTNPSKSFESRFLTVNPSLVAGNKRRVLSPKFNANNQCQCFILPEDDVLEVGQRDQMVPMTTFSQSGGNVPSHNHNCVYRDDLLQPSYYSHCPYTQGPSNRVSQSPEPFNGNESLTNEPINGDQLDNDQLESYKGLYDTKNKSNFTAGDQMAQENNLYTLGIANL